MLKREARIIFKEKRMALSEKERVKLDDLLLIQFQTAEIPFIESLLTYWPIEENNEPNSHLFTEFMRFRNPEMKICYPKSNFTVGYMQAVITDIDTPFSKTVLNILEPQSNEIMTPGEIDMVFVPLLGFDKNGFRLGYGKGFYDKWLADCRDDCIKIGFSYFEPIESIDDRNEFDVPLDISITPDNVYVF
ncbi:MAG TPA: 5-formyltetrahydrofolate cyclo-ligase [Chitinophagaceae bacterium]|nr:5-formyltetrahydrofolate cyclo-ligase [Chitinophagaceae bacterium]